MENPQYKDAASKLISAVKTIINTANEHGFGTVFTMTALGELMKVTTVGQFLLSLPADQRDEFFAEVFDAAIGTEQDALISGAGFASAEALEEFTDGIKAMVRDYFNQVQQPPPQPAV